MAYLREIAGNLDARMHHIAHQMWTLEQEADPAHQERLQRLRCAFEQLLLEREQLHHELMNEQGESSDTRRPSAPSQSNRRGQAIPPASRLCRHAGHAFVCVVSARERAGRWQPGHDRVRGIAGRRRGVEGTLRERALGAMRTWLSWRRASRTESAGGLG